MSFLDTIKDRLRGGDYYDDDYYEDEGYADDGYADESRPRRESTSGHLLGTTPRPEAESVSVYTRSGRPVGGRDRASQPGSYDGVTSVMPAVGQTGGYEPSSAPQGGYEPAARPTSIMGSAQLPPYVLRPVSYDDVQTVVRRVRTNQPVVVVFRNTNIDTAKRILDFCFGFSFGVGGEVQELGDRVFAVLPSGAKLTATDIDKLVADGDLVR